LKTPTFVRKSEFLARFRVSDDIIPENIGLLAFETFISQKGTFLKFQTKEFIMWINRMRTKIKQGPGPI
jgi:hypothetical protein